jgi:hypothetical protein
MGQRRRGGKHRRERKGSDEIPHLSPPRGTRFARVLQRYPRRVSPRDHKFARSPRERIDDGELSETAEITVCRPEFSHAMLPAQSRIPGLVDSRPADPPRRDDLLQLGPVLIRFCEQNECFEPRIDLIESRCQRGRRIINTRMGDDSEKFMET